MMVMMKIKMIRMMKMKMKNKIKKTYSTIGKNKIIMITTTNYQSKYINYNNSNNTSSNSSKQITTNL